MATYPELFGGLVTLGSQATVLSSEITPMCELEIRTLPTAGRVYFGNANVTPGGDNAFGFIDAGEAKTWGPYTRGGGIRPAQVFVAGIQGAVILWSGFPG